LIVVLCLDLAHAHLVAGFKLSLDPGVATLLVFGLLNHSADFLASLKLLLAFLGEFLLLLSFHCLDLLDLLGIVEGLLVFLAPLLSLSALASAFASASATATSATATTLAPALGFIILTLITTNVLKHATLAFREVFLEFAIKLGDLTEDRVEVCFLSQLEVLFK